MLARKRRKNVPEKVETGNKLLRAVGYARLSVIKTAIPSESIENQMSMIQNFVDVNPDIELQRFYVDKKASGRDFDRAAFAEMLEAIDKGEIDCVIVKDLSRLGRSLIDVGYYIQIHFPLKQVRFISVNDMIDTLDGITNISFGQLSGSKIALTSLFDEEYSNDISRKAQAVIGDYIQEGKSVAPRAPYGYRKSDDDCHALVPDPEAAAIVKKIFEWAANSVGLNEIVRRLNEAQILSPINYAISKGLEGNRQQGNGLWNTRSVKKILTNLTYTGDLRQGKENHVAKNRHVSLVSHEIFNLVQELFAASASSNSNKTNIPRADNILKGKVICGSCGGKMQRRKGSGNAEWYFFTCISNNRLGAGHCTGMYPRESDIMDAIHTEINRYVETNTDIALTYESKKAELEAKLTVLNTELKAHLENRLQKYEEYMIATDITGISDEDEFLQGREEIDPIKSELLNVEMQISSLNEEQEQYRTFCRVFQDRQDMGLVIGPYLSNVIVFSNKSVQVDINKA